MNTVPIPTPYLLFRTYGTMEPLHGLGCSTVRYTDRGAFASNPYSLRTTSSSNSLYKRFTDKPVISTDVETNAIVSATTELPWERFNPFRNESDPVSLNTASARTLFPAVIVTFSLGFGIFA
jgi:hypothetical protein